ncbi:RHS repeat-associated core domain-containing protein, partial [Treponema denticola]
EDDPANLESGGTTSTTPTGGYRRDYTWNERNQLIKSDDKLNTVIYRYGDDGQRALKFTQQSNSETLYFNNFYSVHQVAHEPNHEHGLRVSKHIFVGNSRLVTAMTHADNHGDTTEQTEKRYYYHADHLQSAQFITNAKGEQYEHIEYTPYGELWIEETAPGIDKLPFRFTGKELDEETGLYYYGARYLDPKYSRWLSGDPALSDYIPKAPIDDEAKKHNENLPGLGGVYNTVNLHVYHYAGNNPVKYIDPDGRTDYIYHLDDEGNVTKTKENDWGFWEFLHIDRYYVETSDGTRYRANSEETVELYQFNKIDVDFLNQKFNEMVDKANEKPTNLSRIWNESINGDLDFKNDMDETTLYFNGKVLYNNHEAGNFVWAYFLSSKGYGWLHGILAQGGSLFGFLLGQEYKSSRFDEWHDVKARYAGQYYYFKNNKIRR